MTKEHAKFRQEDLSTSSGLLDDVNARFTESCFEMFDYGGKAAAAPAFHSKLVNLEDDTEHDQYWTVGGTAEDWEIGDDGDTLIPISRKAENGINVSSNFGQLLTSFANAGFSEEALEDGLASGFDDVEAHVIRVESKAQVRDEGGSKRKQEVLVVDTLLEGKKTPEDGGESTVGSTDSETRAVEFVEKVLAKNKGKVAKKEIPKLAFNMITEDDDRNVILEYVFSDEFLKDKSRPWNFKNGVISSK